MDTIDSKQYPSRTPEVSKMLKLEAISEVSSQEGSHDNSEPVHAGGFTAGNLPVPEEQAQDAKKVEQPLEPSGKKVSVSDIEADVAAAQKSIIPKAVKAVLPFIAVFAVGIFLYFFFFSTVDFSNILKSSPKAVTPKESVLEALQKEDLANYQNWIAGFYYDVSDTKILDPEADNSGNGLTNFQKYLLNLNPKSYDTLGLGRADSQTLAMGVNPLTGNNLTDEQKKLIDKYFDIEVIMNRLTLNRLQNPGQVAGVAISARGSVFGSAPITPAQTADNSFTGFTNTVPAETGAVPADSSLNTNGADIDQSIPGHLRVPALKIDAPVMWTNNPKNFDRDLQRGVVHYPGTALPGQLGTSYISGHSSNYAWAKGEYNRIFSNLGDLADNTSFQITLTLKNGKQNTYHYVVTGRQEYKADDIAQFRNSADSTVALSTCWPVGSTARRLVVYAKLTQIDQ